MGTYYYTLPTKETYSFFEEGCWYKSFDGITAKFTGIDGNNGWWGTTFAKEYFRMITPSQWEKIESGVDELEAKLRKELEEYEPLTFPIKFRADGSFI